MVLGHGSIRSKQVFTQVVPSQIAGVGSLLEDLPAIRARLQGGRVPDGSGRDPRPAGIPSE